MCLFFCLISRKVNNNDNDHHDSNLDDDDGYINDPI